MTNAETYRYVISSSYKSFLEVTDAYIRHAMYRSKNPNSTIWIPYTSYGQDLPSLNLMIKSLEPHGWKVQETPGFFVLYPNKSTT